MVIFRHELRRGRTALLVWSLGIASMLAVCIFIYPEMAAQMSTISTIFAHMGSFTAAFGMDKINFGEFSGFFSVECGSIIGLGGAFYAALIGISALSKEEKDHTAEFLLTHPVTRIQIVLEKLLALFVQILILNLIQIAVTFVSLAMIDETADMGSMALLFLAFFLMQLETAAVTFGLSAFLHSGGMGIGLGLAAMFYFLNLIANMSKKATALKYLTPFGYTDGADILTGKGIPLPYLLTGMLFLILGIAAAFRQYRQKDIS